MIVDIFIKTYHEDFAWLEYCLKSIKKFAIGFRRVVIVSDNDGYTVPSSWLLPDWIVYYVKVGRPTSKQNLRPPNYVGYVNQQVIKLNWFEYTNADAVFILDSDQQFTTETTPQHFEHNGKPIWFYRLWSKSADAQKKWQEGTSQLLKTQVKYEAMCTGGFTLTRTATRAFCKHIYTLNNVRTMWELISKHYEVNFSEFNLLGSFIYDHCDDYTKLVDVSSIDQYYKAPIRSSWSWGGMNDEERRARIEILDM